MKLRTTTAERLIEELQQLEPTTPIAFASDYGDHVHTQQVHFLKGDIEQRLISENAYSDSGWAIDDDEGTESVYIIR